MSLLGKSVFLWRPSAILGGYTTDIADACRDAGFESAILHSSRLDTWRMFELIALVDSLRARGVTPWASAAVYGVDPVREGNQAAAICEQYNLPGFIFDAEQAFDDKPKSDTNAVKMIKAFRQEAPGRKVGWCWWARYRHPTTGSTWHPVKVLWAAMAPGYGDADFGMPMAYHEGGTANNVVHLLNQSFVQWRDITDKPIIPAGRAYTGEGGTATAETTWAFDAEVRRLGAPGVAWWSMQHAIKIPEVWQALSITLPFASAPTPTPELTMAEKVDILVNGHPELFHA
jgi:hypothetical protein